MFATRTEHKKTAADGIPRYAEGATAKHDSPGSNAVWQSLALSATALQPKLDITQPDDPYEREADRVADRVMRMTAPRSSEPKLSFSTFPLVKARRKCDQCDDEEEKKLQRKAQEGNADSSLSAPPIVHEALNSPGRPLDPITRSFMEDRFDHDFGHVRVHTDMKAAESARAMNALAYTVGRDVTFGAEQFAPRSADGQRLLAHELTHVLQQDGSGSSSIQLCSQHPGETLHQCLAREARESAHRNSRAIAQADADGFSGATLTISYRDDELVVGFRVDGPEPQRRRGAAPVSAERIEREHVMPILSMILQRGPGEWSVVFARNEQGIMSFHHSYPIPPSNVEVQPQQDSASAPTSAAPGTARTFHEGDNHGHVPSGRWADVQADPNTDYLRVSAACRGLSPREVAGLAMEWEFSDKPLALEHLNWYLAMGRGADFIEDANLERMLLTDTGVHALVTGLVAGLTPTAPAGFPPVEQSDYHNRDFRLSFGEIDRLDVEVDFAHGVVHVWFKDRYEFHPYYPGIYDVQSGDMARPTNCVHAAMVELKSSGARDFWMKGEVTLPLSLFRRSASSEAGSGGSE